VKILLLLLYRAQQILCTQFGNSTQTDLHIYQENMKRSNTSSYASSWVAVLGLLVGIVLFPVNGFESPSSGTSCRSSSVASNSKGIRIRVNHDKYPTITLPTPATTDTTTSLPLAARRYSGDRERDDHVQREKSTSIDRPTKTAFAEVGPKVTPSKPKIVVLGASGKIGRLVVQELLERHSADYTVVALVRNYDKAIRVLYGDELLAPRKMTTTKGPKLQIVECDLVPPEELPGWDPTQDATTIEEERLWKDTAQSAAAFRGESSIAAYDNRELLPDINEALEDAIHDCTTIISCVGAVRRTNLWTDLLARPVWRLLQPNVSTWCRDGRHPYYVHYASTRKAVGYAEREQLRREAAAAALAEEANIDLGTVHVPKIRFVRISDLVVGQSPWDLIPLIVNAFHSMVFRYQEMAEQLLQQSTLLETVIIRPGDLVDEERVSCVCVVVVVVACYVLSLSSVIAVSLGARNLCIQRRRIFYCISLCRGQITTLSD
jgi:hypothetical protein